MSALLATAEGLAASWRADAKKRRAMSSIDPSADVLAYCASEMLSVLASADGEDAEITVAEYASMHGKAVSTVRRWCQTGAILSREVGRLYRIRRGEPCPGVRAVAA